MSKDKETTAEEILSKKTGLTIDEDAYRIQTKTEYVLSAMQEYSDILSSPLKTKIEELEKDIKEYKAIYAVDQGRYNATRENLKLKQKISVSQSSANKLAEALGKCLEGVNELNNEYQSGWDSVIENAVDLLTTFRNNT